MIHLVPRARLLSSEQECARLRAKLASVNAQLEKAERTRDGEVKRAALYLDLLTRRDQCVVCGHALEVPRRPPHCDHHAARMTSQHWKDWTQVAARIEEEVRRVHEVKGSVRQKMVKP
jgi:hypothetical protein